MTANSPAELEVLSRAECLRHLSEARFGRVAVTLRSEVPTVRPVNYVFDEPTESVVFRTGDGAKFRGILLAGRAAFEIDGVDERQSTGWSVIAAGSAERITDRFEIHRLERLVPEPWHPGDKPHWIRIRIATLSGRRFALAGRIDRGRAGTT